MRYKRSVEAALKMTESRFGFAEALALDIPKTQGKKGPKAALEAVRQEIIEAGGEALALSTMALYRQTALHFMDKAMKFDWADASFTAHVRAYQRGFSAEDFRASPINEDRIEGKYGSDRRAEVLEAFETLSDEEQVELYVELRDSFVIGIASQREVTPEPTELGARAAKHKGTKKQAEQELELVLQNLNTMPNRIQREVDWMLEELKRILPSKAWNAYAPMTRVERTHGEQVLDPFVKAREIITLAELEAGTLVDEANGEAKARKAAAEGREPTKPAEKENRR